MNLHVSCYRYWLTPILLIISIGTAVGQGWQRHYGNAGDQRTFSLAIQPDGGILAVGSTVDTSGSGQTNWYYLRTDSLGQILAESSWGSADTAESAVAIFPMNQEVWVVGNRAWAVNLPLVSQQNDIQWVKLDALGTPQQASTTASFIAVVYSDAAFGNGRLLVGSDFQPIVDGFFPQPALYYIDSLGVLQWSATYPFTEQFGNGLAAAPINAHQAVLASYEFNASNNQSIRLQQIDFQGNPVLEKRLPLQQSVQPAALLNSLDGQLLLIGNTQTAQPDVFLSKINPTTLDTVWTAQLVLPGTQIPHAALELPDGRVAVVGEQIAQGANSRDAFLAMLGVGGQLQWYKTYGGLKGDIFWDIQYSEIQNRLVIGGQTASFSATGDLQAWLLQADTSGQVWSSRVVGRVAQDQIQNCLIDASEPGLQQWIVAAAGAPGTVYTLTDAQGFYNLQVDTGTWYVSVLPVSAYWLPCEDSITVSVGNFNDTVTLPFPVQVLYECPFMDIDITTPFLRRCFDNTYTVRYFNYGTTTAAPATAVVLLDDYLSLTGSDLPYTQAGDSILFNLGAVPPMSGGTFQLTAFLDCDSTALGQLHCTEAYIFPDSLCFNFNPEWDGSNLEVEGFCAGDSVLLTIRNTGLGMQGPVEYIITEDQIIFRRAMLQLGAGQDTTIVVYPNGATLTILVGQTPGQPTSNQPMLVIEGCGAAPFSTGYAFQFPQNDGSPSVDIECRANVGSFDPNDKTGLPLGVSDEGVIAPGTVIEYLIRFQNTGTDTAFRVEIKDQLSPLLDIASLRIGASSHPNRWKISGDGLLQFIFDPIALPDSAANLEASMGFVKFSIRPKAGIPMGTGLENHAAIIFDQNSPIVTNTTLHTIGMPEEQLLTAMIEPNKHKTTVGLLAVTPNPAHGIAMVYFRQPLSSEGLHLEVADVFGRVHATLPVMPNVPNMAFDLTAVPAGVYYLVLRHKNNQVIDCEKVIKL